MDGVSALNLTKYSISLLCDANAICTNTNGSFSCMCSHGYSGDGMLCTGMKLHAHSKTV